ncbi:MAG: hypothetical protein NUV93_07460 [Firmicutes bacterium]|jgi:DNA polymerase-3 subunit delta'|nr:hypothetical protein [Bacillota bacterium]
MSLRALHGQATAASVLRGILRSGRVAHAYLFTGADGAGKSAFAREFSKALNCAESHVLSDACDSCGSCLRASRGNHPDILEIGPDPHLRMEQVKAAIKHVGYKPLEGRFKVVLLLHAEAMTDQAANCLLKSLEEPPDFSVFVLTAPSAGSVPPTVASRCQPIPFNACTLEDVLAYTRERHAGHPMCEAAAFWSGGIPGRADLFFERDYLGARNKALVVVERISELDIMGFAEGLGKEETSPFLDCLVSLLRDLVVIAARGREGLFGNPDIRDRLEAASASWSLRAALVALEETLRTRTVISLNANRRLAVEVLLLKLRALAGDGYN